MHFILSQQSMPTHHATLLNLGELLRKREAPGSDRREAERQAEFDARYCDTETEYCTNNTNSEEESEWEP